MESLAVNSSWVGRERWDRQVKKKSWSEVKWQRQAEVEVDDDDDEKENHWMRVSNNTASPVTVISILQYCYVSCKYFQFFLKWWLKKVLFTWRVLSRLLSGSYLSTSTSCLLSLPLSTPEQTLSFWAIPLIKARKGFRFLRIPGTKIWMFYERRRRRRSKPFTVYLLCFISVVYFVLARWPPDWWFLYPSAKTCLHLLCLLSQRLLMLEDDAVVLFLCFVLYFYLWNVCFSDVGM